MALPVTASTAAATQITQLYVAMFGRCPDTEGLNFWGGAFDAGQPIAKIAQDMFGTTPARAYFPEGSSSTEIVQSFYVNVLGRQPDTEGLAFWVARLDALKGIGDANAVGQVVSEIISIVVNYQGNTPEGAESAQLFANKMAVAEFWVNENGDVLQSTKPIALVNSDPASVNQVKAQILNGFGEIIASNTFTLKEVVVEGQAGTPPVTAVYWGYNPHGHQDDSSGNEGPQDGGIPVSELVKFLTTITGLDLHELGLIDADGVTSFQNVANLTLSNPLSNTVNGDENDTNNVLVITFADGSVINAEVALGDMYFDFLNGLLFDENGNSRLFERVISEGTEGTSSSLAPIKLTDSINNGGTEEQGYTTAGDDLIVAGRLDLLHGAYIDGGAGRNTLEIDAKGTFAQPKALLNIQEVHVNDLPNWYSDGNGGYLGDSSYPYLGEDVPNQDSYLDLSSAVHLDRLVVTSNDSEGDLTIVGIRNGAVARFEGGFNDDVTLHYGPGMTGPLTIELLVGQVNADLNFVHNSDALHLVSLGGVANSFGGQHIGSGSLTHLKISGDAALYIDGDLDSSFKDATPVTIDASENTKGVDLELTGSETVTFIGSVGDDSFKVATDDAGDLVAGNADDSVTIVDTSGNNHYAVESTTIDITVGDGKNNIELDGQFAQVVAGNGNNTVVVADGFETIAVTVGNGNNAINTDDSETVNITAGNGKNVISSVRGESVTIEAGDGGNTITVGAEEISITTGSGNDTITVNGMGSDDIGGDANTTGLLNIDTGAGNNTVVLGRDVSFGNGTLQLGITALEGSSITGENITLRVENLSDLRAAELDGITRVVLNYDVSQQVADQPGNHALSPVLTLTDTQFLAIGAANFGVQGAVFSNYAQIKIIVTSSTSLTALGADSLPRNLDLQLELQDGVTLTMTAEQLHTKVAPNGITLADDYNTDTGNGKVVITGGGANFDPFNNSDTIKTNIDGTVYYGGSLSDDFMSGTKWYNVTVKSLVNGWDRPADVAAEVVITLDSTGTAALEQGAFSSWHTNLAIIGDQDINFTGDIQLGMVAGVETNPFTIDFSELEGVVNNFVVDNFELLGQGGGIFGNGNNGYASEVHISLAKDSSTDGVGFDEANAGSLVSTGVARYVVTTIDGPTANGSTGNTATIKLCDTAQDIEVFALRGNYNDALVVQDAAWGLVFELQGGGTAKAEGPTGTANVGKLVANYEWEGADAVVNLVHSVAGDLRPIHAEGISIDNADSLAINVAGSAVIHTLIPNDAESLTFDATGSVTVIDEMDLGALDTLDASGVVGAFAAAIDGEGNGADFSFVGAQGGSSLTLGNFVGTATTSIDGGAGGVVLTIDNGSLATTVDLDQATLTDVDGIVLVEGNTLELSFAQLAQIGIANLSYKADAAATTNTATLNLVGLDDSLFVAPDLADGITIGTLTVVSSAAVVTLDPGTDLTGIATLVVPTGTTLNLTAAQYMQLSGAAVGGALAITGTGTVNITGLTQADIDAGFDLTSVDGTIIEGTITLAEDVNLAAGTSLGNFKSVVLTDGQTFGVYLDNIDVANSTSGGGDVPQDGLSVSGGTNTTLVVLDASGLGGLQSYDAHGLDVTTIKVLAGLVGSRDLELVFEHLKSTVVIEIYNDLDLVAPIQRIVNVVEGTTVGTGAGDALSLNAYTNSTELQSLMLNLNGGVILGGDLRLDTEAKAADLIAGHFKTLTINSTGTAANLLNGQTANAITGDITSQGVGALPGGLVASLDNNLKEVVINATQALQIGGSIVFESLGSEGDDGHALPVSQDSAATVTLTVNGTADVTLGGLNTLDTDVDGLVVTNAGTGTLSATLDAAEIDAADALSFLGSNIELTIEGAVNLSDDVLTAVTEITINDGADLTLSQAQYNVLGAANIVDGETTGGADLNLVAFEGAVAFDATALDSDITIESITMAAGAQVLNAATDLTGVGEIVVPEGGTLTLTAAQFQQLVGDGTITAGAGAKLFITDLTQADVDAGFDLSDATGFDSITISLGEASVDLGTFDTNGALVSGSAAVLNGAQFVLAAGQTLGLVNVFQADGLDVAGAANTTLVYKFADLEAAVFPGWNQIDASGYDVTVLKALAASFSGVPDSNVEFSIDDLPSSVILSLYADPADLGFLSPTFRSVVIEEGVTTPVGLIFNDWDTTDEVRSLTLTLEGDATLNGDLAIPTRTNKVGDLVQQFFNTLTINSVGTAANLINGDITTASAPIVPPTTGENSLLNVVINATQNLVIDGDIGFNSVGTDGVADTATLTLTGTANVTIDHLDISNTVNDDIGGLTLANNLVGGTLTVLGGSPAIEQGGSSAFETLTITGTGNTVLGVDPLQNDEDGIDSATLSVIDASGSSGALTIGTMVDVDSANFSFTSGTGVTKVWLDDDQLNENVAGDTGWSFNFANAAAGSELHIGSGVDYWEGELSFNMGANGTLFIDNTSGGNVVIDLTDNEVFLSYVGTNAIVLADGVTLKLRADQANGLNIVAGANTNDDGNASLYTSTVDIEGLADGVVYDFGGIVPAGTITLADDDVTVETATDLGTFSITLDDLSGDNTSMAGQIIRFNTEAQATRAIIVDDTGAGTSSSTSVVWLFNSIAAAGGIDTTDYSPLLGRLWFYADLLANEGGDVEQLFTTLPNTILRVDVETLAELNILLQSKNVDRVMEIVHFATVGDLTFSDVGIAPEEHLSSLTLHLGGQTTVGNIMVNDVVADPLDTDLTTIDFNALTIVSHRAVTTGDLLASELYDNDNDGIVEPGTGVGGVEHVQPNNINTVGNIGVGAGNSGVDLVRVNIDTLGLTVLGNGSAGNGAAIEIGTITYGYTPGTALTNNATLDVTGANNITIDSVVATDADLGPLVTVDATGFTGTLTAPGASPAFVLGAQIEELQFIGGTAGGTPSVINLGSDDVLNPNAGISGAGLSSIDASGYVGTLNLGILALIDGTNDDGTPLTPANDGALVAFTLTSGSGITTATLGMDPDSANVPTLAAGSEWVFNFGAAALGSQLTITDDVVFGAPALPGDPLPKLTLIDVELVIQGDVDLSGVELDLQGWSDIHVPVGQSLTLTHEQATNLGHGGVDVTGEGTVHIVGEIDTDAVVTMDLSDHIHTVGVDLSGLTNVGVIAPQANLVVVTLDTAGALNDSGDAVGFDVTGSAFNDAITGSNLEDTLDGAAGDDSLTGGTGSDTFLVTAGTDTITDLKANGVTVGDDDVLVVSAGATANAEDITSFVATADTVNNGVANLSTDVIGGSIDVSAAGGANGFNLMGGANEDVLTGSNHADVIVGGGNNQSAGDVLTGNGGADVFRFTTSTSTPQELTMQNVVDGAPNAAGVDWERINVTSGSDVDGGTVTIPYFLNGVAAATPITVVLAGLQTAAQVATAIAAAFNTAGFTTSQPGGGDSIDVRTADGVQLEFGTFNAADSGTTATYSESVDNPDVAQATRVTLSSTAPIVPGETYTLGVTLLGTATSATFAYTALIGDDWLDVVQGLDQKIFDLTNDSSLLATSGFDVADGFYLDITDAVADNGGFSVTLSSTGGFNGSSASDTNADVWDSSDVITDFASGVDKVDFQGMVAGSAANYMEHAEVADYATALADANTAMNGTVRYYLTSAADIGDGAASGVLFFDADADGVVDGAVRLTGINEGNFAFADITASA